MGQPKLTFEQFKEIVSHIKYKDWTLRCLEKEDGFLLQAIFMAPDSTSDDSTPVPQHCRKWYISPYSTASEIVRGAYKAVVEAEKHEIDEQFLLDGVAIFDPHVDLFKLKTFMEEKQQDVRL